MAAGRTQAARRTATAVAATPEWSLITALLPPPISAGIYSNDILWNASLVGSFKTEPGPGVKDCYTLIKRSAATHGEHPAVAERKVLECTEEKGFEKLLLGPYTDTNYADYFSRIEAFGSGLQRLAELAPKEHVVRARPIPTPASPATLAPASPLLYSTPLASPPVLPS